MLKCEPMLACMLFIAQDREIAVLSGGELQRFAIAVVAVQKAVSAVTLRLYWLAAVIELVPNSCTALVSHVCVCSESRT